MHSGAKLSACPSGAMFDVSGTSGSSDYAGRVPRAQIWWGGERKGMCLGINVVHVLCAHTGLRSNWLVRV